MRHERPGGFAPRAIAIYSELDRTEERLGLALFWFYVLMTLVILVVIKRRLRMTTEPS